MKYLKGKHGKRTYMARCLFSWKEWSYHGLVNATTDGSSNFTEKMSIYCENTR